MRSHLPRDIQADMVVTEGPGFQGVPFPIPRCGKGFLRLSQDSLEVCVCVGGVLDIRPHSASEEAKWPGGIHAPIGPCVGLSMK